ncbi:MAG TPA: F0F1 ATP synthase subunit B [Phycisphaerales bacterium]|nr:F0F1 ATP synthase subunit B [Phycisphaerales bacterium]
MSFFILAFQEAAEHDVHAAVMPEGGAAALMPAITTLVVFCLLLIVLWRTVWPKITKGLDERAEKIRSEIAAAEQAREQAKSALAEYQQNLSRARDEANNMIAKAKADAKAAAEELRTQNQRELADMKQRATAEIESAKQAAIADLHAQAASLAAAAASKILKREITPRDQQSLVSEALADLASARRN